MSDAYFPAEGGAVEAIQAAKTSRQDFATSDLPVIKIPPVHLRIEFVLHLRQSLSFTYGINDSRKIIT